MKVLVIIDMQKDFMDDGNLPVKGAYEALEFLRDYISSNRFDHVIITADSHPIDHCSFQSNGGQFPEHCVVGTDGYKPVIEFSDIVSIGSCSVIHKGQCSDKEEFSVFEGRLDKLNPDDEYYFAGVAGDICVLESIKSAMKVVPASNIKVIINATASLDGGSSLVDYCIENNIDIL